MTHTDNPNSVTSPRALIMRMAIGWFIGLAVISLFVFGVPNPDPSWGKYWQIRPLIVTPLAGAIGGLCNYYIFQFHTRAGINKFVAGLISFVVFVIGMWMGIVAGLDGTLWN